MDFDTEWSDVPAVIALDDALASAGISDRLAGAVRYTILSVSFKLVTAAGGGARQVVVKLLDATGAVVFAEAASVTQAGGLTVVYSFGGERASFGTAALGFVGGPFVGGRLPQNLTVAVAVTGTSGGDKLSQGRLLVHQLEPDLVPAG